jgi:hypothetical protein
MPITEQQLRDCIQWANLPFDKRRHSFNCIWAGLQSYREHKRRWYYGVCGRPIKKPAPAHSTRLGRHNQAEARFVLINAIYRAWRHATGSKPTLNHQSHTDTAFASFAMDVMSREGIGHCHRRLEEYWSYAKKVKKETLTL